MFKIGDKVRKFYLDEQMPIDARIGKICRIVRARMDDPGSYDVLWNGQENTNGNRYYSYIELIKLEEPNDIMKELCSK